LAPRSPLKLCLLSPVFLDYYLNSEGGYDLPFHPYRRAGIARMECFEPAERVCSQEWLRHSAK